MATDTSKGEVRFWHDFNTPGVDETNEILVGAENSSTEAINTQVNGVYRLTTGATDGNRAAWSTALNYQARYAGPLRAEFRVASVTAITARAYFIGFTDVAPSTTLENPIEQSGTTLTSTASDAVGFMYDTDSTNDTWHLVGTKADADATSVNTAQAPAAAGTFETLTVVLDTDGNATFYINGDYKGKVSNAVTASTALCAICMMETRSGAAISLDCDYIEVKAGRN